MEAQNQENPNPVVPNVPVVPVSTPVSQPSTVLIVLLFLLILGLGIFLGKTFFSSPKENSGISATPTVVVAPTRAEATSGASLANWKTYRNEKYGFEFKYPLQYLKLITEKDWGVEIDCGCEAFDWIEIEVVKSEDDVSTWWEKNGKKVFNGQIGLNNKFHPSLAKSEVGIQRGSSIFEITAETEVSGNNSSYVQNGRKFLIAIVKSKSNPNELILILRYWMDEERNNYSSQILSTFKFL